MWKSVLSKFLSTKLMIYRALVFRFLVFGCLVFGALLFSFTSNSFAYDDVSSNNTKPRYQYNLTIDGNMSSVSSADLAMSAIESYRYVDDYVLEKYDNFLIKAAARASKFLVTSYIMVANHEIGGHGARAREFNWQVTEYKVTPFSGYTDVMVPLPYHVQRIIALNLGGMQASHLLSEKIQDRAFSANSINPTYGVGYVVTRMDQLEYILGPRTMKEKLDTQSGDDVTAYVRGINYLYGPNYLTLRKLRYATRLDLLDPFLFYSLYSYGKNSDMEIPMIKMGAVRYLPATKLVLTPYGIEKRLINHIVVGDKYFRFNLSYGNNKQKSYNASLKTNQIINWGVYSFGTEVALWSQPQMLIARPVKAKVKKGGLISLQTEMPLVKDIQGLISVGYKTDGFMEGMPLEKSAMIRVGIQVNLP